MFNNYFSLIFAFKSLAAILKENKKEISKNEGHKMTTEENQIYTEKNDRNKKVGSFIKMYK